MTSLYHNQATLLSYDVVWCKVAFLTGFSNYHTTSQSTNKLEQSCLRSAAILFTGSSSNGNFIKRFRTGTNTYPFNSFICSVKRSGKYVSPASIISISAFCIYVFDVFDVFLRVNND
jgi:hypothetical protein